MQRLFVWTKQECKRIELLKKACLPNTDIEFLYLFGIRKQESLQVTIAFVMYLSPFQVVKQVVKQILKHTKFNRLACFEHITDEISGSNNLSIRNYYGVSFVWEEPKFYCVLSFKVELDPLTLDEVVEEDDSLLAPRYAHYKFD